MDSAEIERLIESVSPSELEALLLPELLLQRKLTRLRELRNWTPRPYQQPLWDYLQGGGKRACAIWHRRSGKDDLALNWTAEQAIAQTGEYWHMLPEASQGRKVIWDAVNSHTGLRRIDQAFPKEFRESTREQEMAIRLTGGSLWRVVGSDNYDSLVGAAPRGIVLSEWAIADPNAWAFLRPILAENGGWALFITTPRGNNHAKKTLTLARSEASWFAEVLTAKQTGVFSEDELASELREMQHEYGADEGRSFFDQEYFCSFEAALLGSYYGAAITRMRNEGRICSVPIDRGNLVHTSWDLGASDSTGIWFIQVAGREYRFVDYYEAAGPTDLAFYAQVLEDKRKEHRWIYGAHYFPHDLAHQQLGNPDGNRVNTMRRLGITPKVVECGNVNDGINAFRRILDAAYIDEKRCERGIDALSSYHREWDDRLKMFRDAPKHDWASHGADAARTFASGYRHPRDQMKAQTGRIPTIGDRSPKSLGTGWMRH